MQAVVSRLSLIFMGWVLSACTSLPPIEKAGSGAVVPGVERKDVRLGLALGGGAARGFAHVGVIQVLEEAGLRPA